jgi:hypothetical protein
MVVAFGNAGAVGVLLQLLLVLPLLLFLLVLVWLLLLFSWCCCCWARGDDEGVGSVGAAPGVAAAAGMEEKTRSVWGSVDREGCFGCSLSFSFQKHASPFSFPAPSRSTKLSSF